MKPIPAITIHQPWATLIALGAKRFETRSWQTQMRGTLAIHAGRATESLDQLDDYLQDARAWTNEQWRSAVLAGGMGRYAYHAAKVLTTHNIVRASQFPRGSVVCLCELVACHPVETLSDLSNQERAFGDYSPGRYAWELQLIQLFQPPVWARGAQGVWGWQPPAELFITQAAQR